MINFIIKRRFLILAVALIISLPPAFLIPHSKSDPDLRNYVPDNLVSRANTSEIEKEFGTQDMVLLLFESDDILSNSVLPMIEEIVIAVQDIDGIARTVSPFSIKNIYSADGFMMVEPSIPSSNIDDIEREILRGKLRDNELIIGNAVSSDLRTIALTALLEADADEDYVLNKIDSVLDSGKPGIKIYRGGLPYIRKGISEDVTRDGLRLIPMGLLVMLTLLWLFFRKWTGMILPFIMVILAIIPSMGLVVLLGWKVSILSLLVPVMLIAIANNYGIHIVSRFEQEPGRSPTERVKSVIHSLRMPVLFTGI